MKIKRQTPNQLILENNPIWLAPCLTLFALLFIGAGLLTFGSDPLVGTALAGGGLIFGIGFSMAFIRRTQLILDGPQNRVELRRRSWFGFDRITWELQHLDRAITQTSRSGDTDTHRAALVFASGMDAGVHPITMVYSSGTGAARAETAINDWLGALDSPPSTA